MNPEITTVGRIGVDLYPMQSRRALADVDSFARSLGGSATNVAVAAAQHGHSAAVVSGVGGDAFGEFCRRQLARLGVSDAHVVTAPSALTPLTFCALFPPDDFPLFFHRRSDSPDLHIGSNLDAAPVEAAALLWVSVSALSRPSSRQATYRALQRARGAVVLDLDYRPALWAPDDNPQPIVERAMRYATAAIGNRSEWSVIADDESAESTAQRWIRSGLEVAVVKRGPEGVYGLTSEEEWTVPQHPVTTVNGLGAGDAFGGAFCHGHLSRWDLEETLRFANTAGALVAAKLPCAEAMPTTDAVLAAMRI